LIAACQVAQRTPTIAIEPSQEYSTPSLTSTPTPDPCTGWTCELQGVVYTRAVEAGNELARINLTLFHSSNCSPTRGEYQTQTDENGTFSFGQIFFHDTDRVRIQINTNDTSNTVWDSVGQYCYYCSCFEEPIQLILPTNSGSQ
jgi:hypothetical protein